MLEPAQLYTGELRSEIIRAFYDPHFKYYFTNDYIDLSCYATETTWNDIDFVSVQQEDDEIFPHMLGYLGANISRSDRSVTGLAIMNFTKKPNMTFSRDLWKFLRYLTEERRFRKINWSVAIGNPAEELYDRVIAKYGGRVVGIRQQHCLLSDGSLCDQKLYEYMNPIAQV